MTAIRSDILNGQLEPGTPLQFAELNQRYAASTGVLREVLPRLVEQGLATTQPQLGFKVVAVSVLELEQLTEARVVLETLVLEQSMRCGDLDWESAVVAVKHRLMQTPTFGSDGRFNLDWLEAHRRFHEVLLEGCPSSRLRELAQRLRDVTEVYRCWAFRRTEELPARDVEHERLAKLAVARDVDGACHAMREHIQRTTDHLIESYRRGLESVPAQSDPTAAGLPVTAVTELR